MIIDSIKLFLSCSNIRYHTPNNASLTNIAELTFYDWFNSYIDLSTLNVKYISFGNDFDQHIVFPRTLQFLKLGYRFNKIIRIPKNLTSLCSECYLSIETSIFARSGTGKGTRLRLSLSTDKGYGLPKKLLYLALSHEQSSTLALPKNINVIYIRGSINTIKIPKHVSKLELIVHHTQSIVLNKKSTKIVCGVFCPSPMTYPKTMRSISIYELPPNIHFCPKKLLFLALNNKRTSMTNIVLPETLEHLKVIDTNMLIIQNMPNSIVNIEIYLNDEFMHGFTHKCLFNLPNSMGKYCTDTEYFNDLWMVMKVQSESLNVGYDPMKRHAVRNTVLTKNTGWFTSNVSKVKYLEF